MPQIDHPLSAFVLHAFTDARPAHDQATIAPHLSGATAFVGRRARSAMNAYWTVAGDVLGCLLERGYVVREPDGWHRITGKGRSFRESYSKDGVSHSENMSNSGPVTDE